jgi:hypothetical protein
MWASHDLPIPFFEVCSCKNIAFLRKGFLPECLPAVIDSLVRRQEPRCKAGESDRETLNLAIVGAGPLARLNEKMDGSA